MRKVTYSEYAADNAIAGLGPGRGLECNHENTRVFWIHSRTQPSELCPSRCVKSVSPMGAAPRGMRSVRPDVGAPENGSEAAWMPATRSWSGQAGGNLASQRHAKATNTYLQLLGNSRPDPASRVSNGPLRCHRPSVSTTGLVEMGRRAGSPDELGLHHFRVQRPRRAQRRQEQRQLLLNLSARALVVGRVAQLQQCLHDLVPGRPPLAVPQTEHRLPVEFGLPGQFAIWVSFRVAGAGFQYCAELFKSCPSPKTRKAQDFSKAFLGRGGRI